MSLVKKIKTSIELQQVATLELRLQAALLHLSGTLAVACLTYLLIRQLWYPGWFWLIAGGASLFLLVCAVDAALGPALTFAVFDPSKGASRLRRDLVVIVVVQLLALGYGLWTVFEARPLFLVFSTDRFNLVTASDIGAKELKDAEIPEFRKLSYLRPQTIGTREGRTGEEKIFLIESALAGRDRHLLPKTYLPFDAVKKEMLQKARPLEQLKTLKVGADIKIKELEQRLSKSSTSLSYVPIIAIGDWIMILDATSGEFVDVLEIDAL
jgi:hypothetical protein